MAQDIVADALNEIMNAMRVEKKEVRIKRVSNLLIELLKIMKKKGLLDYSVEGDKKRSVLVKILKLNYCKAIKPRFFVKIKDIEKYLRRYLPSRRLGTMVISTSQGLKTHEEALENKIGGCLIAFFY